ncbi:MAG TPA: hypothetical protein VKM00_03310 [Luteimonas sp.]|nr:hypothetical protein [Luteimonas sp.]
MTIRSFVLLSVLALLACAKPAHAAQSYDNCAGFITTLPAIISAQGTWCLNKDLNTALTSGNAITINANNVTLDCNDFKLGGLAAGLATQTIGVFATDRVNLTIRHCNIRGFVTGIFLTGALSGGHAVEDNRLDGNTDVGMDIEGDGSVVRRNRIFDTGGSTVHSDFDGIYTSGSVDVLDNTVSGVVATSGSNGYAIGMFLGGNVVSGNHVSGLVPDGTGVAWGIHMNSTGRFFLTDNNLLGDGSSGSEGLSCIPPGVPYGRAKDNVVSGFATGNFNCGDAGGNDISP